MSPSFLLSLFFWVTLFFFFSLPLKLIEEHFLLCFILLLEGAFKCSVHNKCSQQQAMFVSVRLHHKKTFFKRCILFRL